MAPLRRRWPSVFSVFSVVEKLFNGNFTTEVTEDTEDCNDNSNNKDLGVAGLGRCAESRFH
jgi:hypothetical protein